MRRPSNRPDTRAMACIMCVLIVVVLIIAFGLAIVLGTAKELSLIAASLIFAMIVFAVLWLADSRCVSARIREWSSILQSLARRFARKE